MRRTTVRRAGSRLGAFAVVLAVAAGLAPGVAAADEPESAEPTTSLTTTEPPAEPTTEPTTEPAPTTGPAESTTTEPPPAPTTAEPPPPVTSTTGSTAPPSTSEASAPTTTSPEAKQDKGSEVTPRTDFESFATVQVVANLDVDGDGIGDPGNGVAGVSVQFANPVGQGGPLVTGEGGEAMALLPPAVYTAYYQSAGNRIVTGPGGVISESFDLTKGPTIKISLNVVDPLYNKLRGRFVFDQPSYAPGAPLSAHVLLTNTSSAPLTRITANCSVVENGLDSTGAGWGVLRAGGPGATVPARGTLAVAITDVVPAAAAASGFLAAHCFLTTPGHPMTGLPSVSATVPVESTALGGARGRLFEAGKPGVGVPGVGVSLRDPRTGDERATGTTDGEGRFGFDGIPVGEYELGFDPAWRMPYSSVQVVRVTAANAGEYFVDVERTTPEKPQPANLSVLSATLDKASYISGEPVRLTLVVRNTGATAIERAVAYFDQESNFRVRYDGGWGELDPIGQGARIGAGETRTFTLVADASDVTKPILAAGQLYVPAGDANFDNNRFVASAALTAATAPYSGRVYVDADGNGSAGPAEGLAGVAIHASGGVPYQSYTAETDSSGRFAFAELPTGDYSVYFWNGDNPEFVVLGESGEGQDKFALTPAGRTDVSIRATRALSRSLSGAVALDRSTYRAGEQITFSVTLSNTGTVPLTGVRTECDLGESVFSSAQGWAPIGSGDAGATLAAGETRTFTTRGVVPAESHRTGRAHLFCELAADGHIQRGRPHISATARVVGAFGTRSGQLFVDADGDHGYDEDAGEGVPVAGVKVILRDSLSGKPVVSSTADGRGRFTFTGIAAGVYDVYVVGPWKLAYDPPMPFHVIEGEFDYVERYEVVAGPDQPDLPLEPLPGEPGGTDPGAVLPITGPGVPIAQTPATPRAVTARAAADLAHTGVDVRAVLSLGVVTLLLGGGVVVATRRRRAA